MADNEQMNKLIKALSESMGADENTVRSAVRGGDYSRLISKLDPQQAKQFQALLSDEESARRFLNTPGAKAILKRLMG